MTAAVAIAEEECVPRVTPVSSGQAYVILEPLIQAVRERFVDWEMERFGSSKARKIRAECWKEMHDAPRHFAGCSDSGLLIAFAPEVVELPEQTVLGIMAHEFGHAMDFLYPGRFVLQEDEVVGWRDLDDDTRRARQASRAAISQWQARDADQVEQAADAIARHVTGQPIGYTGPCLLQTMHEGGPRPAGLR